MKGQDASATRAASKTEFRRSGRATMLPPEGLQSFLCTARKEPGRGYLIKALSPFLHTFLRSVFGAGLFARSLQLPWNRDSFFEELTHSPRVRTSCFYQDAIEDTCERARASRGKRPWMMFILVETASFADVVGALPSRNALTFRP